MNHNQNNESIYTDWQDTYESGVYEMDKSRLEKVYSSIPPVSGGNLLEIGCLSGKFLEKFKQKGWTLFGIDIIDEPKDLAPGIKFAKVNVEKGLPFESKFFKAIYAGEVIEHLYDTDFFIEECYRVLEPSGILIITTPNLASLINRFRLACGLLPRYAEYRKDGAGHIHLYTLRNLRDQLTEKGFVVQKAMGNFLSIPDPTPKKIIRNSLLKILGTYLPTLSENLIVIAKKRG